MTSDRRRIVAAVLAVTLLSGTAAALALARTPRRANAAADPSTTPTEVRAPAATEMPPSPTTSATGFHASPAATATARIPGLAGVTGATSGPSRTPGRVSRLITWLHDFTPEGGGYHHRRIYVSYHALAAGECRRVYDTDLDDELTGVVNPAHMSAIAAAYHGAAAACLAEFHGRASLWSTAATDLETASGVPASRLTHHDRAVLALLRTLVRAHEDDADVTLVGSNGRGGYVPCPRLLSLAPDHGPVDGGYEVVAAGEHLPPTIRIELRGMGTAVGRTDASGTRAVFTMPPADPKWLEATGGRTLKVQTRDWPLSHSVEFTFDEPTGGGTGG